MSLLEKTRKLNKVLQQGAGDAVRFSDLAQLFGHVFRANTYILNIRGKLLGVALIDDYECDLLKRHVRSGRFPADYNDKILSITESNINCRETENCVFDASECQHTRKLTTIIPVVGRGERLGTMLIARFDEPLNDDDVALAEFGATILAMEILRARQELASQESRQRAVVEMAVDALSYSELEAIEHIIRELGTESEGLLVASKIADQAGITRSVIVNALRKLESAGVIESRSLGMKGTYIKVLNNKLLEEMAKQGH
ncbi:MAG: GTP-sensing transcriptional pleiotropic repressor CodY [Firmicutes bacterium]|nr:GTP-sensing transcriptional pleiotropic repressor CodY [candidate division NPL-UPA2 bacterium]MBT9154018.1 GTP-sensing transcriptional pleiotropic repressor CodY [candidate division NPL-UPA2 bacterium]